MIRLISKYESFLNKDAYIDRAYKAPLLAEGFRADLAKYCLESLIKNKIVLHQYHSKKYKEYHEQRIKNSEIFRKKFFNNIYDNVNQKINVAPRLIADFYSLCDKYNTPVSRFLVLMDACPSFIKNRFFNFRWRFF